MDVTLATLYFSVYTVVSCSMRKWTAMAKDFYSVLDIPPFTSKEEIREAYLRLARQYHPDVSEEPSAKKHFEEISQAYTILSNEETRIFYNLYFTGVQEEDQDDLERPLPWWQKHGSTLTATIVLAGALIGLLIPFALRWITLNP
jgi:preprotein translocase subunit Sec63